MKVFFITFGAVFLAELADKTQLATLSLVSKTKSPFLVFCGSVAAYSVVALMTVIIGMTLVKFVKPEVIKYAAASLFVLIGILMFWGKL